MSTEEESGPELYGYGSSIMLGEAYLDGPTGLIGIATALQWEIGGICLVKLEWRNGPNPQDWWTNEGRCIPHELDIEEGAYQ